MQFVLSTPIALVACLLIVLRGPDRALWVFFALLPFGAMAAFNLPAVGNASIVAADLAAVTLFFMVLAGRSGFSEIASSARPDQPGFALLLFFIWAALSAVFLPRLFMDQTDVFAVGRVANEIGIIQRPLMPTSGNISQLFRLSLGIMTFAALSVVARKNPDPNRIFSVMVVATAVHFTMGWLDVFTFAVGRPDLMEIFRTANYSMIFHHMMIGMKRMTGGFPEASAFGYLTLGLFGFWVQYWVSKPQSRVAMACMIGSFIVLLRSTSSSAWVAAIAFLLIFSILNSAQLRRGKLRSGAILLAGIAFALLPVILMGLFLAYELSPVVESYVDRILLDKMESASGVERMSWNVQAFQNFWDTRMIGAGLGSVRASNWLAANLASLGVIGTGLILMFLYRLARLRYHNAPEDVGHVIKALQMACLALLLRALVVKATPNLELVFYGLSGLAAGLTGAYSTEIRRVKDRAKPRPSPVF